MLGGLYYIKRDTRQLDFDDLFINVTFQESCIFQIYVDYSKLGNKIIIWCLSGIKIQLKVKEGKNLTILQLNLSHKGFGWAADHLCHFKKILHQKFVHKQIIAGDSNLSFSEIFLRFYSRC